MGNGIDFVFDERWFFRYLQRSETEQERVREMYNNLYLAKLKNDNPLLIAAYNDLLAQLSDWEREFEAVHQILKLFLEDMKEAAFLIEQQCREIDMTQFS